MAEQVDMEGHSIIFILWVIRVNLAPGMGLLEMLGRATWATACLAQSPDPPWDAVRTKREGAEPRNLSLLIGYQGILSPDQLQWNGAGCRGTWAQKCLKTKTKKPSDWFLEMSTT